MLSVIIPSRNERFLVQTIADLLKNATGDIEVVAVLDGYEQDLPEDRRVHSVHSPTVMGMRKAINEGVKFASGDYVMKLDGHCSVAYRFDEILTENIEDNWVVVPRRYSLDAENWQVQPKRPVRDYHYLCYPDPNKKHDGGMHGVEWPERTKERQPPQYDIDDTPCLQGSCWMMSRKHWDKIGGLYEGKIYGTSGMAGEPVEICLKTWLSGGSVKVNKRTWYAHLHKGKAYGRGYSIDDKTLIPGQNAVARYWVNDEWPGATRKFEWLVDEKFPDMPTWFPGWQQQLRRDGVIHD